MNVVLRMPAYTGNSKITTRINSFGMLFSVKIICKHCQIFVQLIRQVQLQHVKANRKLASNTVIIEGEIKDKANTMETRFSEL